MPYADNPYTSPMGDFAALAQPDVRAGFITKTYLHLVGAIGAFVGLEVFLQSLPGLNGFVETLTHGPFSWVIVLGLFMFVSYVASNWAQSATSRGMQYMGLGLYVVAEAVIFIPLIYIARIYEQQNGVSVIMPAALTTVGLFGALTAAVFITRKDFSFLRAFLFFGGIASIGFFVVASLCHFAIGPIFIYAMIALSCGYVLYHTSNVMLHYRIGQEVAAALALFASVALLFWYVLQLFMSRRN